MSGSSARISCATVAMPPKDRWVLKETTRTSTDSWSLRQAIASMPGGGVGISSVAPRAGPARPAGLADPSADGSGVSMVTDGVGVAAASMPSGRSSPRRRSTTTSVAMHAEHERQQHRAHQLLPSCHAVKCARWGPHFDVPVAFRAPPRAAYP